MLKFRLWTCLCLETYVKSTILVHFKQGHIIFTHWYSYDEDQKLARPIHMKCSVMFCSGQSPLPACFPNKCIWTWRQWSAFTVKRELSPKSFFFFFFKRQVPIWRLLWVNVYKVWKMKILFGLETKDTANSTGITRSICRISLSGCKNILPWRQSSKKKKKKERKIVRIKYPQIFLRHMS